MMIVIKREKEIEGKQTIGKLTAFGFTCNTLELAWKDNQKSISCIPKGNYKAVRRHSNKYGEHLHILGVYNRDYILIHSGNYYTQIEGCVLVGQKFADINKDGIVDVTNSRNTLKKLMSILPEDKEVFDIKIC